ncbi:protein-methionine-sulfoxide reductase heme-binding subunit MsrQ [Tepidimonas charontis]|uniref:Protein-methionine-sulfoxide reductase heme-binding subunit MsrQ n=1 Tax=Tepidimonas charontis TaxID=2267262 RepID=A0A554XJJ9_9BURK|nr:protein-methionine-sulfoxide reductase heme-binding subunit MsrQ [Tepidimonas charontis]TSE35968.1 Protein-methionine-sulfoxide reductase heme-binding subunit MsrQ [Tepidimonas charontis]
MSTREWAETAVRALRPWVMTALVAPALWLWGAALADRLGANPAEALIRGLGDWALGLLCATLAVTPLREATGWRTWAAWRRPLGLWTFTYAAMHLLAYAWLDQGGRLAAVVDDVAQRPFIAVGMATFGLLVPLAATSHGAAVRWLGALRWRALHRAVYVVAALVCLHFWWMRAGKRDYADVVLAASVLALLLGWRGVRWWWTRRRRVPSSPR